MTEPRPMRVAGTAMLWQAFQMGGVKALYMTRLLVLAILLTPADFGLVAIATAATGFLLSVTNFDLVPAAVQVMIHEIHRVFGRGCSCLNGVQQDILAPFAIKNHLA